MRNSSWVREQILITLRNQAGSLIGITALAVGADQLFADVVLEMKGELYVVLPFSAYEETFASNMARKKYLKLLDRASYVEVLPRAENDEQSFLLAGYRIVELADIMIGVWNGKKAEGRGGTADIVARARVRKVPLVHINPISGSVLTI